MKKTASYLLAIALVISAFIGSIEYLCFNEKFYIHEYAKLNIEESTAMDHEDLLKATDVLLEYIKGERDDMVVYGEVDGKYQEIFNDKEKAHMVDVRSLYTNVNDVLYIAVAVFIVSLVYLLITKTKGLFKLLYQSYKNVLIGFLAVLIAIALMCFVDFNRFWNQFHKLFFTNDLWLLDPSKDIMIKMVPEDFFYDLILGIAAVFVILLVLIFLVLNFMKRRTKND